MFELNHVRILLTANVALNKNSSHSEPNYHTIRGGYAIDGHVESCMYFENIDAIQPAWYSVDLGGPHVVRQVILYNTGGVPDHASRYQGYFTNFIIIFI